MIYLGADHGGFELKNIIKNFLSEFGYEYKDLGSFEYNKDDDYPDYAFKVAEAVAKDNSKGILMCRSASGVVIAANKVKNIRAVVVTDVKSAIHSREHNDANVLGLSGNWMSEDVAKEIVKAWLTTDFSNEERHIRRLKKISDYEH